MSYTVHGTCGRCGGAVVTPTIWMGIYPPVPTCQSCGATPKQAHGPVIDMDEPKPRYFSRPLEPDKKY